MSYSAAEDYTGTDIYNQGKNEYREGFGPDGFKGVRNVISYPDRRQYLLENFTPQRKNGTYPKHHSLRMLYGGLIANPFSAISRLDVQAEREERDKSKVIVYKKSVRKRSFGHGKNAQSRPAKVDHYVGERTGMDVVKSQLPRDIIRVGWKGAAVAVVLGGVAYAGFGVNYSGENSSTDQPSQSADPSSDAVKVNQLQGSKADSKGTITFVSTAAGKVVCKDQFKSVMVNPNQSPFKAMEQEFGTPNKKGDFSYSAMDKETADAFWNNVITLNHLDYNPKQITEIDKVPVGCEEQ